MTAFVVFSGSRSLGSVNRLTRMAEFALHVGKYDTEFRAYGKALPRMNGVVVLRVIKISSWGWWATTMSYPDRTGAALGLEFVHWHVGPYTSFQNMKGSKPELFSQTLRASSPSRTFGYIFPRRLCMSMAAHAASAFIPPGLTVRRLFVDGDISWLPEGTLASACMPWL
ncbi:hypothetical protein BD309DRAFT_979823 [Dichomitus squalens]|nr:hypothetical protein BD309DRAFT_979823 [Dichomitus squalens]